MDTNIEFDDIFKSIMDRKVDDMEVTIVDADPRSEDNLDLSPIEVANNSITSLGEPYNNGTLIDKGVYIEHGPYEQEAGIVLNNIKTSKEFEGQGLADAVVRQIAELTGEAGVSLYAVPSGDSQEEDGWFKGLGFDNHTHEDGSCCMKHTGIV